MIRLLLADDEPMIRAGIRAILSADADIEIVAEAADGRAAVQLTQRHRPDVALLDIRMPQLDGLAATMEIRRTTPNTGVIVLTTFGEDSYIADALGNGASGFLLKSGDPRELLAGIHAVAAGAAYLSPEVAKKIIAELNSSGAAARKTRIATAQQRVEQLTNREREVLSLVGSGLSNAEIAGRIHVVEARSRRM
ncbi:response regulator transcription factor [Fodinicola feengrottensis]|uniref:response regulator transcription factor n=1 Tax=Fodinicola feengrottensis TaxID=435914 RepID=UPI002441AFFD|nr:response regulator transcription factor [Fodinicola feengrottensis]